MYTVVITQHQHIATYVEAVQLAKTLRNQGLGSEIILREESFKRQAMPQQDLVDIRFQTFRTLEG